MSADPLVNRILASVQVAMTNQGIPQFYLPTLEFIVVAVLNELATDQSVQAQTQTTLTTDATTATTQDPSP